MQAHFMKWKSMGKAGVLKVIQSEPYMPGEIL